MTFESIGGIFCGIILIAIVLYQIIVRCPKCKSIWTTEEQKTQLRSLINGNTEYLIQRRCKKCNMTWNEYVERKR